jgi:hypothetical protein
LRQPVQGEGDQLSPDSWQRAWRLRRLATHLAAIDSQDEFNKLANFLIASVGGNDFMTFKDPARVRVHHEDGMISSVEQNRIRGFRAHAIQTQQFFARFIGRLREELIQRYEAASAADDFETMRRMRHVEWTMEWPQSGERIVGHDNYVGMRTHRPEGSPRVSLIVAARNEEAHVEAAVGSLLALDYPDYEVIAVNRYGWTWANTYASVVAG